MFKTKDKTQNMFEWLSTFKWRLHWLKPTTPKKWLYRIIYFYRCYEPIWLAKITDRSFAYQIVIDETLGWLNASV